MPGDEQILPLRNIKHFLDTLIEARKISEWAIDQDIKTRYIHALVEHVEILEAESKRQKEEIERIWEYLSSHLD